MQVSAVWSCVRLITETVGTLPLEFYNIRRNVRSPLDKDHYLNRLFNVRPNRYMTPLEFREAMTCQLALWGNAYALIDWIGQRPVALIPLKPEHIMPYRTPDGITYHYTTDQGVQVYAERSIFHLKGFSTEGIVGLSPLAYSRQVLGVTVSADRYAAKSFANGGRPGGVLMLDKFLTADQRETLRAHYQEITATADNAGKMWVLEGGMQYQGIAIPPDDMQMLESRRFQLGEIARIFRVPSHLINDTEKSTSWGSGIDSLNLGFLQYTLRPYLETWETVITNKLLRDQERNSVVVEHNVDSLLRTDAAGRADYF
jgi:HK97 family phage portal protein